MKCKNCGHSVAWQDGYAHVNRGRGGRAGAAKYELECFVKIGDIPKEQRMVKGWTLFCGCKIPAPKAEA